MKKWIFFLLAIALVIVPTVLMANAVTRASPRYVDSALLSKTADLVCIATVPFTGAWPPHSVKWKLNFDLTISQDPGLPIAATNSPLAMRTQKIEYLMTSGLSMVTPTLLASWAQEWTQTLWMLPPTGAVDHKDRVAILDANEAILADKPLFLQANRASPASEITY